MLIETLRKIAKILFRSLGVLFDFLLALIIILAIAIKFYGFQTYIAKQLAGYISAELGAEVSMDKVEIDLLRRVQIKGLLVRDLKADTLLYAPSIKCVLSNYSVRKRFVHFSEMEMIQPRIKIAKYKGDKDLNFQFIADYLDDGKKSTSTKKPWKVYCHAIKVKKANFSMNNYNKSYSTFGIDFDHLGLYPLNVNLTDFKNIGDTSSLLVKNLSFREKSGFICDTLNTRVSIAPGNIMLTPLTIKTPYSRIKAPYFSLEYLNPEDFDYFERRVKMVTHFQPTRLYLGDLSYFAHELEGSRQMLKLEGGFEGTVDNFYADHFAVTYSKNTYLKGNFKIKNLRFIDKAEFDLDIKKLALTAKDLRNFEVPPYDGESFLDLPSEVNNLGDIDYKGEFRGSIHEFKSNGTLLSSSGLVTNNIHYKKEKKSDYFSIDGNITSENFNLGKVVDESSLGVITGNIDFKGRGKDFKRNLTMKLDGDIPLIGFNDYNYSNVSVHGLIHKGTFTGDFNIKDDNVYLSYNGYYNYLKHEYDFSAKVYNAAITKLNFGDRDESATLSFKIKTKGKGIKVDDLRGNINIYDIEFCENRKNYLFDSIRVEAKEFADSSKKIFFNSDFALFEVNGKFNFEALPTVFVSILSKAVPSLFDNQIVKVEKGEVFTYKVKIKDFSKIQELFFPDLQISKDVSIDGKFDSNKNIFRFSGKNIKKIKYGDQFFEDLTVVMKNNDDILNTNVKAEKFQINDSIFMQKFDMETQFYMNNTESHILWNNKSGNSGNLSLVGSILEHDKFNFRLEPSTVKIKEGTWKNDNAAIIRIDSTAIEVTEFNAYSGQQSIAVNGVISENATDQMVASLCNFKLESITPLFIESGVSFKGDVNGNIVVADVYEKPDFVNSIAIDSFYVNNEWVGDLDATNFYEKGSDRIVTKGQILRKGKPTIDLSGNYYLEKEHENLDYKFVFDNANLRFINGFLPPDVSNFQSLADGHIKLSGSPDEPIFNGKMKIHNGSIKINMLNTSYFLESGTVDFYPDMIALNTMKIADVRGNTGMVNGTYNHKNFENSDYSFDLQFNKMLCLNTTEEMNDLYYGKAYASGTASILGYGDKIDVEITAKTDKNTKLTMPMYGVSDVTVGDFIVFVNKDSVLKEKDIDLDGITLIFNLDVTPDAEVNIVFDKLSGQQLKARGKGPIKMEITPLGEFLMNGEYEIEDPSSYKLAMQTIINKNFMVAKGGKIKWYGDPLNAEIDLKAIYQLQASVYDIMPVDIQSKYRKNVPVNVEIQLKNSLYKPDFNFDFVVPKADENVRSAINAVKNTKEELFRQTMSLLIINKFLTPSNAIGTASQSNTNIAANYTSELITNQLNSLLSQISKDFDIGVNYKPGDEISNEEIAVALSKQIMNGRMSISGNFGVSNSPAGSNQSSSSLIGDFNLEYLLTPDGNFKLRAYNESNDFDITNQQQAPYTQGVAVSFQREYDVIPGVQKFLNIFRKDENDWVNPDPRTRQQKRKDRKDQKEKEKLELQRNEEDNAETHD